MKKILKITLLALIIILLNINTNYAATPTLSDIANKLNSIITEIKFQGNSMELLGLECIASSTTDTLKITLQHKEYDESTQNYYIENEYFDYSFSNNILSRTSSSTTYEEIVYSLLIDSIGQLNGHKPGDLYYTLYGTFYSYSQDARCNQSIYDFNLENHGISVKNISENNYEFKADITKTVDFSNVYITESDLKDFEEMLLSQGFNYGGIAKGFIIFDYYLHNDNTIDLVLAEKNNLTENTYKSILSLINVLYKNSDDKDEKISNFKRNFPNLSVGDTTFDGIEITVAPSVEEADIEYWNLGYNETYKLVKLSVPYIFDEEFVNEPLNTTIITNPIHNNTNNTNNNNNSSNNTNKLQQNVNKVTNSITKLPQTGNFHNKSVSLYILSIITFILLLCFIISDVKYKNINNN